MFKLSRATATNLMTLIILVSFYYMLLVCTKKMFGNNLLILFILIKKTCYVMFIKTTLPTIIDGQQPVKTYSKVKWILLTWKFEKQSINIDASNINAVNNKKLLVVTYKKSLIYFILNKLVTTNSKTIQDLKTLINGWKIREIQ